jgi:repressor LexA
MKKTVIPLTEKEKAVLEFVEQSLVERGISPSYQEIRDHFGFASFNSVQNYLKQLQNKGYILIPPHQKRAIQILKSAEAAQVQVRSTREQALKALPVEKESSETSVPLLGKVAAGRPLEAMSYDEFVEVPRSMLRNPDKTFALRVVGQSMIEDGILDGDLILIQKQANASNGEIVVATVDNESTVKRFYLRGQTRQIELRPANSEMKPMFFSPEQVEIKGVVVGLIRKF